MLSGQAQVIAAAERDGVVYRTATEIAAKALGIEINTAVVGVIDPSVFALIDLIAGWIMKILQMLRERLNPDEVVESLRRPRLMHRIRANNYIKDDLAISLPKYKRYAPKLQQEMFSAAAQTEEDRIKAGIDEVTADDLLFV